MKFSAQKKRKNPYLGCYFPINLCQNPRNGKSWLLNPMTISWRWHRPSLLAVQAQTSSFGLRSVTWKPENPHWPSSQKPWSESHEFAGSQVTATSESLYFFCIVTVLKTGTKAHFPWKTNLSAIWGATCKSSKSSRFASTLCMAWQGVFILRLSPSQSWGGKHLIASVGHWKSWDFP